MTDGLGLHPAEEPVPNRFPPVTADEKQLFDHFVMAARGQIANTRPALMRIEYRGEPAALITTVWQDGEDVIVSPIAMLVDDELFEAVTPPEEPDEVIRRA